MNQSPTRLQIHNPHYHRWKLRKKFFGRPYPFSQTHSLVLAIVYSNVYSQTVTHPRVYFNVTDIFISVLLIWLFYFFWKVCFCRVLGLLLKMSFLINFNISTGLFCDFFFVIWGPLILLLNWVGGGGGNSNSYLSSSIWDIIVPVRKKQQYTGYWKHTS